jgi:hypothetical protein
MKFNFYFLLLFIVTICISSCGKESNGIPEAQGGLLPTNYITITDSSFSPNNAIAVKGSSFTFVNQSGKPKGLYSIDSLFINKPTIDISTSYYFKKDTLGTFYYFMAGKPSVTGSITLVP